MAFALRIKWFILQGFILVGFDFTFYQAVIGFLVFFIILLKFNILFVGGFNNICIFAHYKKYELSLQQIGY